MEKEYKIELKSAPGREKVEVLGPTYESGKPESKETMRWRQKLAGREQILKYLTNAERYWYAKEGYGSEKRKKPA